mmetsp:Transcript_16631/g.49712  ORF Transcript_16631/g.49712 Transcript_16631/m.49712 type:complete len:95 (-) Transcript_16631:1577-1861(-)
MAACAAFNTALASSGIGLLRSGPLSAAVASASPPGPAPSSLWDITRRTGAVCFGLATSGCTTELLMLEPVASAHARPMDGSVRVEVGGLPAWPS